MPLSSVTRVSDGIQKQYDFDFGYLRKSHVFVFVNNELRSFKWLGPFQIELLNFPQPDATVTIRRLTDRVNRITTFTDGQTILAEDLNAADLQTFYIAQEMLDQIEERILAGEVSVVGSGYITAQWIQEQLAANIAGSTQFQAISDALDNEALERANALAAEALARAADIAAEAAARGDAVFALEQADLEAGQRLDVLEAEVDDPDTGIKARIGTLETVTVDLENNKADASVVSAIQAAVDAAEAQITTIDEALATETAARTSQIAAASSRLDGAEASLTTLGVTVTNLATSKAEASELTALTASVSAAANRGQSVLPDPLMKDNGFWNVPAPGYFSVPGGASILNSCIDLPVGSYDFFSDYFPVLPGGAYRIRFRVAQAVGGSTGWVQPMIHVPNAAWLRLDGLNVIPTDPAQAFDIATDTGWVTTVYTNPTGVTNNANRQWQFRIAANITGGAGRLFVDIESLPHQAEITTAQAAIVAESTARASGDSANATSISQLSARTIKPRPNLMPRPLATSKSGYFPASQHGWTSFNGVPGSLGGLTDFWSAGLGDAVLLEYWSSGFSTAQDRYHVFPGITGIGGGLTYTLSMTGRRQGMMARFYMYAADAGGSFLGQPALVDFDTTKTRKSLTYTTPPGTAQIAIVIQVPAQTVSGYCELFFNEIKLEQNAQETAFNQDATVNFLREAMATGSSSIARLLLGVNTTTNVATIEAVAQEGAGVWNGSAITLQADLIRLLARNIDFGTRTQFEDTRGTLYNTEAGRRLRILGPFGASNDLVLWYGNSSVPLQSETKTNGAFGIATDGKVYIGGGDFKAGISVGLNTLWALGETAIGPGGATVSSATVTTTITGAVGTLSGSWVRVEGDAGTSAATPFSATTYFYGHVPDGGQRLSYWRYQVTDSQGSIGLSPILTVELRDSTLS